MDPTDVRSCRPISNLLVISKLLERVVSSQLVKYLKDILFLLYTADLLQLISHHLVHPHAFADDTQIYRFCKPSTTDILCQNLPTCVNDASKWLKSNRLLLNLR